jgi:protein-tyrosine phosphatase
MVFVVSGPRGRYAGVLRRQPTNAHQHLCLRERAQRTFSKVLNDAAGWDLDGHDARIQADRVNGAFGLGEPSHMRILFICMGNICRSPTAEGVFRHVMATQAPQLQIEIDSAGTHDYHVGAPPDRRSIAAAKRRGIDLSALRARMVATEDFSHYDLILAMDEENLSELKRRAPPAHHERIRLMMEFAPQAASRTVPDPYYGGAQGFEEVLDLLEEAASGLMQELLARHK